MERKNMVVDISPFLLLEATGDSEADSDPALTRDPGLTSRAAYDEGYGGDGREEEEDAESCSSEWSSYKSCKDWDVGDSDCGDVEARDDAEESGRRQWTRGTGSNERVEQRRWPEAEESCVSEEINSFDGDDTEINKKPSGLVSSEVHLSEMEKSRMFWEACLAS